MDGNVGGKFSIKTFLSSKYGTRWPCITYELCSINVQKNVLVPQFVPDE